MQLNKQKADVRRLKDMADVIYDKEWLKSADPKMPLYFMWRNVTKSENDAKIIKNAELRYDILEFAPMMLGIEFMKTAGHEHSLIPNTKLTYPEIYEVLKGEVYYLMQKFNDHGKVEKIYAVHCLSGDKCIIPPNFHHITINPTKKKVRMANWIALDNISNYDTIKQLCGAGYIAVDTDLLSSSLKNINYYKDGIRKDICWIKNKNYKSLPALEFYSPTNFSDLGFNKNISMYNLTSDLSKLDFLKKPQNYNNLWERILK